MFCEDKSNYEKGIDYINNLNMKELESLIYDLYYDNPMDVREYILKRCDNDEDEFTE